MPSGRTRLLSALMHSTPTVTVRRLDRSGLPCALLSSDCVEVAVSLNSNDATIWERQGNEWKQTEILAEVRAPSLRMLGLA